MPHETDTTIDAGSPGTASVKVPAWLGGGGVVALVILQAMGFDPSTVTGQGQAKQLAEMSARLTSDSGRIDRAWTEINAQRVGINELKSDNRILFERSTNGETARSDIKSTLKDMAVALSLMQQSAVRVETKIDALIKADRKE